MMGLRGGPLDPRVALPTGLMVVALGVFWWATGSGVVADVLSVVLVLLGLAHLVAGAMTWRRMRARGARPGADPPL